MTFDVRTRQFGRFFSEGHEAGAPLSLGERRQRRARLFAESPARRVLRVATSAGAALARIGPRGLLGALDCLVRDRVIGAVGLPDPRLSRARPEGLCGVLRGPTAETLMEGYARGLHAIEMFGVATWQSPARRFCVAPVHFVEPPASAGEQPPKITLDRDFDAVVAAAGPLLSPRMKNIYAGLHEMGFAHSFEVRDTLGKLLAGGYGLALGRVYVTLGQFETAPGLAAFGLAALNRHLVHLGFALHDGLGEESLASHGFAPMSREDYFAILVANSGYGRLGRWQVAPGGYRNTVAPAKAREAA